jgi:2-polyprenyl-3-methyl-5-hydroxy-6-metoxy-1,4-benzoquinol methylase
MTLTHPAMSRFPMQRKSVDAVCEVCDSKRLSVLHHNVPGNFDVAECSDCGLKFVVNPPAVETIEDQYESKPTPESYLDMRRPDDPVRVEVLDKLRERLGVGPDARPTLFDVGAGAGDFVQIALENNFDATGNDISPEAIIYASQRFGIELTDKMLDQLPSDSYDALTMWCVLAHVPDPKAFLAEAYRVLKPGGVMFLRTPRWCSVDDFGFPMARLGGRFKKIADRRVALHHLRMYDEHTLPLLFARTGFTEAEVRGVCHYTFEAKDYFRMLGVGDALAGRIAPPFESMIGKDLFVKNVLFAYVRKPLA